MLNYEMFYFALPDAEVQKLDDADRIAAAINVKAGRRPDYSPLPAVQALGPMRPLIYVLPGHSRQSRFHMMGAALRAAEELEVPPHARFGGLDAPTLADALLDFDNGVVDDFDAPDDGQQVD